MQSLHSRLMAPSLCLAQQASPPHSSMRFVKIRRSQEGENSGESGFRGSTVLTVTAMCEDTTATTIFVTPELRDSIMAGRVKVVPLHYSSSYKWFRSGEGIAGGVLQVPPPQGGSVGLGIAADFIPALAAAGVPLVAQVNPEMPDVQNGPRIPVERFAAMIEEPARLIEYDPGAPSPVLRRIAEEVANLVQPGDTIQLGLGKLQPVVVEALQDITGLGFHGGMVTDAALAAADQGGFSLGIKAGVALGSREFYRRVAGDGRFCFASVAETHDAGRLGAISRFVAINTVLEVDLFGQCNGEFVAGRQITGHGGLVDFIRGAGSSIGGRSIIALPSTAKDRRVSRIVAQLDNTNPVTVPRADAQWVVTEHGAAFIGHAGMDERAELLIGIADPAFRDQLAGDWAALRNSRMA